MISDEKFSELIEERDQLSTKLGNLTKFIGSSDVYESLSIDHRVLLCTQRNAMHFYLRALNDRIELISNERRRSR